MTIKKGLVLSYSVLVLSCLIYVYGNQLIVYANASLFFFFQARTCVYASIKLRRPRTTLYVVQEPLMLLMVYLKFKCSQEAGLILRPGNK